MIDIEALADVGITRPEFVAIAIYNVPCGIKTVEEALADTTNIIVNGPRALLVIHWKGIISGLAQAEAVEPLPDKQTLAEVGIYGDIPEIDQR